MWRLKYGRWVPCVNPGWDYTPACALNCPTAPQAETHTCSVSPQDVCGMQGIWHSGFSVCSPGNQGLFELMSTTWLGSLEKLRAIPEPLCSYFSAGIHLTLVSVDITNAFIWYFHEETLTLLGSGFHRWPCVKGVAAASAALSTHWDASKSLP